MRAERYAYLAEARSLLLAEGRRQDLQWHHKVHRTAGCMYVPVGDVHLHHDHQHGRSFFSGVQVCGSPWSCPVCAAKIAERRRQEIQTTIDWAYAQKLQPVMVTLTFPHQRTDNLGDLLDKQRQALAKLRKGRSWDLAKQRWGFQGLIRALEVTHSERNGWHPHTHEIWLVRPDATAGDIKTTVLQRWKRICEEVGLLDRENEQSWRAFDVRSVDVKPWVSAGEYLAKMDDRSHWGADREMSGAASKGTKGGKRAGRHPFKLLAESLDGNQRAGRLFLDFVRTVTEKRARALFFSPGLKKRVGIEDLSDEDLAVEQREEAEALGALTRDDWRLIRRLRQQAPVLDAAEAGGWPAVVMLLAELRDSHGIEQPKRREQTPEQAQAAADASAAELQQQRHEQATEKGAQKLLDGALAKVARQAPGVIEQEFAKVDWPAPALRPDPEAGRYRAALVDLAVRQRLPLPLVPGLRVDRHGRQIDGRGRPLLEWTEEDGHEHRRAGGPPARASQDSDEGTSFDSEGHRVSLCVGAG
nr:protein rep [uncultured Halomonas sp.]